MTVFRGYKLLFHLLLQLVALPSIAQFQADSFIEKLLKKHPERFSEILNNPDKYKVQVLYTRIDRNKNNVRTLLPMVTG
jgi:predicted TPR repeat methyltransferase